jgi:hypothetical protein
VVNYRDFAPYNPKKELGFVHAGQEIWISGGAAPPATRTLACLRSD